eukprot:146915-Prymnesium_polylepis.1
MSAEWRALCTGVPGAAVLQAALPAPRAPLARQPRVAIPQRHVRLRRRGHAQVLAVSDARPLLPPSPPACPPACSPPHEVTR